MPTNMCYRMYSKVSLGNRINIVNSNLIAQRICYLSKHNITVYIYIGFQHKLLQHRWQITYNKRYSFIISVSFQINNLYVVGKVYIIAMLVSHFVILIFSWKTKEWFYYPVTSSSIALRGLFFNDTHFL